MILCIVRTYLYCTLLYHTHRCTTNFCPLSFSFCVAQPDESFADDFLFPMSSRFSSYTSSPESDGEFCESAAGNATVLETRTPGPETHPVRFSPFGRTALVTPTATHDGKRRSGQVRKWVGQVQLGPQSGRGGHAITTTAAKPFSSSAKSKRFLNARQPQ